MLPRSPGVGRAQVMVGDHGLTLSDTPDTLPDSPEQRQKLARLA